MKNIIVSVEGETEEYFVKDVLTPYLAKKEIYVSHTINLHGYRTYSYIKKEILATLYKYPKYILTTFYDYYGLSKIRDFAGLNLNELNNPVSVYDKINTIQDYFYKDINHKNFIPFIQLHEFEALLFIDENITCEELLGCNKESLNKYIKKTRETDFKNNPELINNSTETAPSKLIEKQYPKYQKTMHGINITKGLGIHKIMETCPHFKEWIEKIEDFGN